MRKMLLSSIFVLCAAIAAKAQIAQSLVLYPSPTAMNSMLNVQYNLYNNTPNPITTVQTSAKINNVFKGVINTQTLATPLLPGQTVPVNFAISVIPADFALGTNIIIVFPTGDVFNNPEEGAGSSAYITPAQ